MTRFRALLLVSLGLTASMGLAQQRVSSLTGNIQHLKPFHSSILNNDRNVAVYLPPDYDTNKWRRYPVLYMNDGQNVFDGMTSFIPNKEWRADESAEALIAARLIEPLIIVAIDNHGIDRADEFLPTRVGTGNRAGGGKADLYGRMLIEELLPYINKSYRTKLGADNTGLCGSSYGGILTMHLGLTHPEVFGKLAVVSPSVWWDSRVILKEVDKTPRKPKQRVWIDIGTSEAGKNESQSNQAIKDASDLYDELVKKGWRSGKDIAFFSDKGAQHNEEAWAHRMPLILEFLFPLK